MAARPARSPRARGPQSLPRGVGVVVMGKGEGSCPGIPKPGFFTGCDAALGGSPCRRHRRAQRHVPPAVTRCSQGPRAPDG